MWIGIPILLPHRFHKVLSLREYVVWFWLLKLKGGDCFTGVPNFILISQAVYELSGFQTLKIGHIHTHTHTYIRTPAKNHISRRFLTFQTILSTLTLISRKENFSRKYSFLSEEAKVKKISEKIELSLNGKTSIH